MPVYAGVGSRETPPAAIAVIEKLAQLMGKAGYLLRTGGAVGADMAFLRGHKTASVSGPVPVPEIYLPWPKYNFDVLGPFRETAAVFADPTGDAIQLARQFHPAWGRCSGGAKKLHGRNSQILCGFYLNEPVDFVVCWHNNSGGTMQAIRLAQSKGIKIYHVAIQKDVVALLERIAKRQ